MSDNLVRSGNGRPAPYVVLLARGLRRRCSVCGGVVFESWFRQAVRCRDCNFPTTRVPDQWIGAYGMNIIASFAILVATIAAGFALTYPHPPVGVLLFLCVAVAVIVPVVLQPISRSLWAAIDVAMRPPEPRDFVDRCAQVSPDARRRADSSSGNAHAAHPPVLDRS